MVGLKVACADTYGERHDVLTVVVRRHGTAGAGGDAAAAIAVRRVAVVVRPGRHGPGRVDVAGAPGRVVAEPNGASREVGLHPLEGAGERVEGMPGHVEPGRRDRREGAKPAVLEDRRERIPVGRLEWEAVDVQERGFVRIELGWRYVS